MKMLRNKKGITILEVMSVVVIIGILAAIAYPQFDASINKLRFRGGAKDIVSKLRLARSKAISEKRPYGISFNASSGSMITFIDSLNLANNQYDFGDPIVKVDSFPTGFNLSTSFNIVYRPNGSASQTKTFTFTSNYHETTLTGEINILASTGRTKITSLP